MLVQHTQKYAVCGSAPPQPSFWWRHWGLACENPAADLSELRNDQQTKISQIYTPLKSNSFRVSADTLCRVAIAFDRALRTAVTQSQTRLQVDEKKGRNGSVWMAQRRGHTAFRQSEEKWPQCSYSISRGLVRSFVVKCIKSDWNRSCGRAQCVPSATVISIHHRQCSPIADDTTTDLTDRNIWQYFYPDFFCVYIHSYCVSLCKKNIILILIIPQNLYGALYKQSSAKGAWQLNIEEKKH